MKKVLFLLFTVSIFTFISCGGDDDLKDPIKPSKDVIGKAPVFTSSETVSVDENQTSALTLVATDADKDKLTYSISDADASSFTVNGSTGVVVFNELPVYATKSSYTFTANVSDGKNNVTQTVVVNIELVIPPFIPMSPEEIKDKVAEYNTAFKVDPKSANTLTLKKQIEKADVTNVTDMSFLFNGDTTFNLDISAWNTSGVYHMESMFQGASAFNQNISAWDTSKISDMSHMFFKASAFNQNIGDWKTSKVTDMNGMFYYAVAFNQNVSEWDTSNVTNMKGMFWGATIFNQDLSRWNVSSVKTANNNQFDQESSLIPAHFPKWKI